MEKPGSPWLTPHWDESLGADVLQSVGEGRGGERRGDNRRDDFGFHGLSSSLESCRSMEGD